MEPKEGGEHNLYVKLTDADEEFQIFTLAINIIGVEKEEEPEEVEETKSVMSDDLLAKLAALKKNVDEEIKEE
jgi:hypothetical protein